MKPSPAALLPVLVACFAGFGSVLAVTLEVKEGNSTCIKAELTVAFRITYNTSSGPATVSVSLPDSSVVDEGRSSCGSGGSAPWLVGVFGSGHALGLSFWSNGSVYRVVSLSLQYNLSDPAVFPESTSTDVVTVTTSSVGIWASINTTYRCFSPSTFNVGVASSATFSNTRLEAFMEGNDLSPTESVCPADQSSTVAPPSSGTTAEPPEPGTPDRGTYWVNDANGTICLLAQMGLQLNVSLNQVVQNLINLNPVQTNVSGSCESSSATLSLNQEPTAAVNFTFTLNSTSNQFHLSGISLLLHLSDGSDPVSAWNSSLDYMRTSLGRSYMCNQEQQLEVVQGLTINTFRLQVQPFGLTTNQFSTAEECQVDQDQMLIPIIVGAALAGLVLIVLIAYLIGRRRSHAGYQTI